MFMQSAATCRKAGAANFPANVGGNLTNKATRRGGARKAHTGAEAPRQMDGGSADSVPSPGRGHRPGSGPVPLRSFTRFAAFFCPCRLSKRILRCEHGKARRACRAVDGVDKQLRGAMQIRILPRAQIYSGLAQLVVQRPVKAKDSGSNPEPRVS